ncbi:MAG: hypothetical protein K2Y56_25220 [Methylobacterium sp.]|uniref:hypothetical protein n=1 Tax=Methylobacterium sp. TaxID=409 RepID=UPI0025D22B74|nr:hypothetical protein [Methylobacterium sp.]MBX9934773.1 hypothetical protein [Methylobacterium sp.]
MAQTRTVGELFEAKAIREPDVVAAVDAFMAAPNIMTFLTGEGYTIHLTATLSASPFALA